MICDRCSGKTIDPTMRQYKCDGCGAEFMSCAPVRYCAACSEIYGVCAICGGSQYEGVELESAFPKRYKVINKDTGKVNNEVLVLDPNDPIEMKAIMYFASITTKPLSSLVKDWVDGYTENRCMRGRKCPITGSPICCCHCTHKAACLELKDSPICGMASTDTVSSNKECLEEPLV